MKNRFLPGFLTGIAAAFLAVAAINIGIYGYQYMNQQKMLPQQESSGQETQETLAGNSVLNSAIITKMTRLEQYIDKYYLNGVESEAVADGVYKGLLSSLEDPYSTYYTAEEYEKVKESTNGVYCGIGTTVTQAVDTGIITVVMPFEGGPAEKAGMQRGDIIYKVDGTEVTGKDLTEVVALMKGEKGTTVEVQVIRDNKELNMTIVRDEIEVPTISYKMLDDKIGYIIISEFDEVTAEQFRKALEDLESQGMKGLVIDLRNNGGGRLDAVVDMLDRMLPEGKIVYTKNRDGEGDEYTSTAEEEFTKPLAVLINGNSASASEIFAGAVQDYEIGTLVGTTSFGKGIVQNIFDLQDGTAVKLTTAEYFTPKGRNIHGTGLTPDVEVELDESLSKKTVISLDEDNQLQKAIEEVKKEM